MTFIVDQNITDINLDLLKRLLKDKTTNSFIRWASHNYLNYGREYGFNFEITPNLITGPNNHIIKPREAKTIVERSKRTKSKAEVFTPAWLCNKQNNLVDEDWFQRPDVFNKEKFQSWSTNSEKISFPNGKNWNEYVDARRLEISCGEAPYLVSRYDTVSGKLISLNERIGLLDRKIRIVNENAVEDAEWIKWVTRAFQSVYGYEYQGDNVLLARQNLLLTFVEYYMDRFGKKPQLFEANKIATIISWNIWQMDGITMSPPVDFNSDFYDKSVYSNQIMIDGTSKFFANKKTSNLCKIFDWRANHSIEYKSLLNRRG